MQATTPGGGISEVVDDTTPTLGGNLDGAGKEISDYRPRWSQGVYVADTTPAQGDVPITHAMARIGTCASDYDSVDMLSAVSGKRAIVYNSTAQVAQLFPGSGENFVGEAANASIYVLPGQTLEFVAVDDNQWAVVSGRLVQSVIGTGDATGSETVAGTTTLETSLGLSVVKTRAATDLIVEFSAYIRFDGDGASQALRRGAVYIYRYNAAAGAGEGNAPTGTQVTNMTIGRDLIGASAVTAGSFMPVVIRAVDTGLAKGDWTYVVAMKGGHANVDAIYTNTSATNSNGSIMEVG